MKVDKDNVAETTETVINLQRPRWDETVKVGSCDRMQTVKFSIVAADTKGQYTRCVASTSLSMALLEEEGVEYDMRMPLRTQDSATGVWSALANSHVHAKLHFKCLSKQLRVGVLGGALLKDNNWGIKTRLSVSVGVGEQVWPSQHCCASFGRRGQWWGWEEWGERREEGQ